MACHSKTTLLLLQVVNVGQEDGVDECADNEMKEDLPDLAPVAEGVTAPEADQIEVVALEEKETDLCSCGASSTGEYFVCPCTEVLPSVNATLSHPWKSAAVA